MCLVVILTQVDGAHNWLCRYFQASASPPPRVQTPTSSAGRATVSQPTASRPPHALLSTARARTGAQAVLTPPAQPEPAPSPPVAATAQADLFSLDFHAPAPSQEPQQPKKDAKADILSLFASTPAAQQQQQPVQSQFGGPTSMVGQNGTGMWGVQSGWAGTQASAPAADPWGSFSSAAPQSQVRGLFRAHKMFIPICSFLVSALESAVPVTECLVDTIGGHYGNSPKRNREPFQRMGVSFGCRWRRCAYQPRF